MNWSELQITRGAIRTVVGFFQLDATATLWSNNKIAERERVDLRQKTNVRNQCSVKGYAREQYTLWPGSKCHRSALMPGTGSGRLEPPPSIDDTVRCCGSFVFAARQNGWWSLHDFDEESSSAVVRVWWWRWRLNEQRGDWAGRIWTRRERRCIGEGTNWRHERNWCSRTADAELVLVYLFSRSENL